MNIESLREFCLSLPSVTEDIKWGNDLCFLIAGKMFCVTSLSGPFTVSFKVRDEEFEELSNTPGFIPAPYVARYKWVQLSDPDSISARKMEHYIRQSYELIKSKLPKKYLID